MRRFIWMLSAAALIVLLAGCPSPTSPGPAASGVYVAGYYNDGSNDIAAYWIDGAKTDLSVAVGATDAYATGIFVDGADVYVSGYYDKGGDRFATYWLNGLRDDLTGAGEFVVATGIYVSGGDIYVSGSDSIATLPLFWRNGSRENLRAVAAIGIANRIVEHGGLPYAAGSFGASTIPYATIWRDTTDEADLSGGDPSHAFDITIASSGDLHVAGDYFIGARPVSVFWTVNSGTLGFLRTELHNVVGSNSTAYGVDEEGGTVYTAGFYDNAGEIAAQWSDTAKTDLPGGSPARAWDVAVESGVVYAVGYYTVPVDRKVAVLWQDGAPTDLHNSGLDSVNAEALAVFVVP